MNEEVKWTLIVKKKKGGGATYQVSNGKTPFPVAESAKRFRDEDASDNCVVVVTTGKSGTPEKVTIPGKPEVQPQATKMSTTQSRGRPRADHRGGGGPQPRQAGGPAGSGAPQQQREQPRRDATAPYNFVTAESPLGFGDDPSETRYSGEFVVTGEALTPLLVASPQQRDADSRERKFFSVDGKPVVPGSSLKGMIRSAVETLARAPMHGFVSKTTIGTRDVSDQKSGYSQRFSKAITEGRLCAGFLEQRGADRFIKPCEYVGVKLSELQLNVRKDTSATDVAKQALLQSKGLWVGFTLGAGDDPNRLPLAQGPKLQSDTAANQNRLVGQLVPTGGMPIRGGAPKDKGYIFHNPTSESVLVPDDVVKQFEDQRTKAQNGLLDFYQSHKVPLPVFFLVENKKITAYGLCRFFRVATEHLPVELASKLEGNVDERPMSELLFGSVGLISRRGRVRCSFGTFSGQPQPNRFPPGGGGIVAGNPAASAITMYLVQDSPETYLQNSGRNRSLRTYDDTTLVLRGRKLYWHRQIPYAPQPPNDNANVQAVYYPLSSGATFTFTVSFERLTLRQLGALCEAIDFPVGHAHKLGLGKPFGLGSVRLTVDWSRTHITADKDRYASLSARLNELAGTASAPEGRGTISAEKTAEAARKAFCQAIVSADGKPAASSVEDWTQQFEKLTHVKQMRALTNWVLQPEPAAMVYMNLSAGNPSYKEKPILEFAENIPLRQRP